MTPGLSILLRGGFADGQRVGPFAAVPPEIRIPFEVEHAVELPEGVRDFMVQRYFPSMVGIPGVFVAFGAPVKPNRQERMNIERAYGVSFSGVIR